MSSSTYFTISALSGYARCGSYLTARGSFDTPNFMPIATRASVKGVDCERLSEMGAQIILVNTYHLSLRPSAATVERVGGIHLFCGWKGPILSDSGGFQIFSLENIRSLSEEGVEFRSHIDGAKCFLSPEISIQIQEQLGVDIAMVLDECPSGKLSYADISSSLGLTNRWARRSLAARRSGTTRIFAITQGGIFHDLRSRAAAELASIQVNGCSFDGFAIGGLSVGEPKEAMYEVLSYHPRQLPHSHIRYLMGVGTPEDIIEAVRNGVDLFDCVIPTRGGRFGRAYVSGDVPVLNLRNTGFSSDPRPLDESCGCVACRNYSRAYLHHLFRVDEMLGPQLLSIHNLTHYLNLLRAVRAAIQDDEFESFYRNEKARWRGITNMEAEDDIA